MSAELSAGLKNCFEQHPDDISPIVPFNEQLDKICHFDFTHANTELNPDVLANTELFSEWISQRLQSENCRYGVGGYNEHRTIYSRSDLFDTSEEPRRLHLGVDIWGQVDTPVFSPIGGIIHSFKFNNHFGDYGATLILKHAFNGITFHSLYGHLSLKSIENLEAGAPVVKGQEIGAFGDIAENGYWPPHLHFQLIFDMQGMQGDYPGVCRYSEREIYLNNCPDPGMILKHTFKY